MGRRWWMWWCSAEWEQGPRGLGVGDVYRWCLEREAWLRAFGEGDGDMGRWWRKWRRSGERERQERGPGELWQRLREWERCEWGLGMGEASKKKSFCPWGRLLLLFP